MTRSNDSKQLDIFIRNGSGQFEIIDKVYLIPNRFNEKISNWLVELKCEPYLRWDIEKLLYFLLLHLPLYLLVATFLQKDVEERAVRVDLGEVGCRLQWYRLRPMHQGAEEKVDDLVIKPTALL